ncbi:MAG: type I methionyl aminopeptidase [Thermomicrobium sp.]|nr:type I methionyl aminopeptidase [Thermomicrobium sp.]MDW7982416.1 type I methionyl aminopeptidase [Thermomicrobium sp.]
MSIVLKSSADLERMRHAGRIAALVLRTLRDAAKPGVTTGALDDLASAIILREGAEPAFRGYRGFPATICTSVNHEVLHGIPGRRVLHDGDVLKIDVGVRWRGFHADAAITVIVGRASPLASRLVSVTEEAFWAGYAAARAGNRLGDIGAAIEEVVRRNGFAVIEGYSGHGVGRDLHEEPSVPNMGIAGRGLVLRAGMTLAIEPMVSAGDGRTRIKRDGWTVVTEDGSLAAHYEHTVWISPDGPVVLTQV